MGAAFTRGHTYAPNDQITNSNLDDLITSATLLDTDRTNVNTSSGSILTAGSSPPPNPYDKECWLITPANVPAIWDDTNSIWRPGLAHCREYTLHATSSAVVAGHLLDAYDYQSGSDPSLILKIAKDGAERGASVVAVALHSVAAGSNGVCLIHGVVPIKVEDNPSPGNGLIMSEGTEGVARECIFGIPEVDRSHGVSTFAVTLRSPSGGLVWATLKR